jgi:hypothetical protein
VNIQYGFHIWFKVCKPFRIKYSLSTNCILVLNGAHLYNTILNKPFTRYNLLKFVSYYDNSRIGKYITVLVEHGFIIPDGLYRNHQMYCISGKGKQVIQELNESYNSELIKFCSLYNIEV